MVLDNIREISKEKGLSLAEVCRRAGVQYNTLKEWDKAMPNMRNLVPIAETLGVTLDELLKDRRSA